jgi:effector-binding domain-containing protein
MAAKVKTTEPKVEQRAEKHYAGIRTQVPMKQLSKAIPELTDEVLAWLAQHGIEPAGPSIVRYHVIDMADKMEMEMGMIVDKPVPGDDRVKAGMLPAGRYASLIFTGVRNGYEGNKRLIGWAQEQGLEWDRWDDPNGDAFASRYEALLTNPDQQPDMSKWETEVAIKVKD